MRKWLIVPLALAGGFAFGLLLSELIGIAGYLLFGYKLGIRYLPIALGMVGVAGALVYTIRKKA
ncbi:DUF5957 family protein [Cohnella massiliensis]|uniref:DUF5957 family protein n=1 Tax=Cohnella massiliensis TaxID=1816691 RepID=UPI0009BAB811|nr:DUF5957 family protein [Cohnella massiliensis]